MERTYVGAIDQGTAGTRFMIFDRNGRSVASTYANQERTASEAGWVEQDPVEIWENTKHVVRETVEKADLDPSRLAAIGVTNQRETTVVWHAESGAPVHDALVWRDRRTAKRIEGLYDRGEVDWIRERTGVEPDAYFSASKVEWILDNADATDVPGTGTDDVRELAERGELRFGTIDSWLLMNLTGNHVTDVTNASRTMLFDVHDLAWDDDLLAEFSVPRSMVPEVRPSSDAATYGTTDPDGFLGAAVPVTGALGDQQAALVGQTCFDTGEAKNTYGTGSFYLMNTGEEAITSENGLLTTVAYQLSGEPAQYALEGSIFTTGAGIERLADVGLLNNAVRMANLARSVDSTDGVYVVPAFTGLGAPHWDSRARGTIVGITRGTRQSHIARATLEAIAYQTRDVAEAMAADAGIEPESLRVDGSAVKNNFLCQMQADLTQMEIVRPEVDATTALGAAYMAGLAVGYWDSLEELRENWAVQRRFEPDLAPDTADRRYGRWGEAVERSLGWETE